MQFNSYSNKTFEDWYWDTPFTTGIGGSEVSHIEIVEGLKAKGHDVISYAPIPDDKKGIRDYWKHYSEVDYTRPGIWIFYRTLKELDNFPKNKDQTVWVLMQDTHIIDEWTKERTDKIDKIITLCGDHRKFVAKNHPEVANKIDISTNGIRTQLINEIELQGIKRDPKALIWASSPDRGLDTLIKIFKRAYQWDKGLTLNVYYGFNNIDKCSQTRRTLALKELVEKSKEHPGIKFHGRINQMDLYKAWFSSGVWCYPTSFCETSCITCLDAQACGVIPITTPLWALKNNVRHGVFIQGDVEDDSLIQARYVEAILAICGNPNLQLRIREEMVPHIRAVYDWHRVVEQLEGWGNE